MEQLTEFVSKSFTLDRAVGLPPPSLTVSAAPVLTAAAGATTAKAVAVGGPHGCGRSVQSARSLNFTAQNLATSSLREKTSPVPLPTTLTVPASSASPPASGADAGSSSRRRSSSDAELDKEDDDDSRGSADCCSPEPDGLSKMAALPGGRSVATPSSSSPRRPELQSSERKSDVHPSQSLQLGSGPPRLKEESTCAPASNGSRSLSIYNGYRTLSRCIKEGCCNSDVIIIYLI
ncbi:hypothetical protein MTO96_015820 [Rhipicephalus appendiculatus]